MTLSNIFFGKKVVQQAYLNNALIYQSKGWETMPSACSEVWTKELGIVDTDTINQCLIDKNNNIYVLIHYQIFKLNSEGTLIWSKTIDGIQRIAIDSNDEVYAALISDNVACIVKLDNSGAIVSQFFKDTYMCKNITDFALDKNYFYISFIKTNFNAFIYKIDNQGEKVDQCMCMFELNESTLVASDNTFLYLGSGNSLIKIDKSNISNYTLVCATPSSYAVSNVVLDEIGNAFFTDIYGAIYKYDFENKVLTEYSRKIVDSNPTIALDYQKNLYFISDESNAADCILGLIKYSSDGTFIFDTQILTDQNKSIFQGKLYVDNNGYIYYFYNKYNSNLNYSLMVKKLINIEQKGN